MIIIIVINIVNHNYTVVLLLILMLLSHESQLIKLNLSYRFSSDIFMTVQRILIRIQKN
jgi:hypothetical protein